jgi:hypothetical protein
MAGADPKPGHTRETFDAVRSLGVLYSKGPGPVVLRVVFAGPIVIGAMAFGMFAGIERRMTGWAQRGQHA